MGFLFAIGCTVRPVMFVSTSTRDRAFRGVPRIWPD